MPVWLPTFAPSRYRVKPVPVDVSTARCHFPSFTGVAVVTGFSVPSQNSPYRSPLLSTYSDGVKNPSEVPLVIGSCE